MSIIDDRLIVFEKFRSLPNCLYLFLRLFCYKTEHATHRLSITFIWSLIQVKSNSKMKFFGLLSVALAMMMAVMVSAQIPGAPAGVPAGVPTGVPTGVPAGVPTGVPGVPAEGK